jgi:FtsH-binding integral membrane protein
MTNASDNNTLPKQSPFRADEHPLKFEYETLIEEYRTVNSHNIRRIEADDKNLELILIAIGTVVAASSIAVQQKAYALLLVLAIPFHVLFWVHMRRALTGYHLIKYTIEVLAPRLNAIIQRTSTDHDEYGKPFHFESWEGYVGSMLKRRSILYYLPKVSSLGKILLEVGGAAVLLVAYILSRVYDLQYVVSAFDTGLLLLNALISIISLFYLAAVSLYLRRSESY